MNAMKITVLGASGKVSQTVALMLKQSPYLDELCLYDKTAVHGFAKDLSYIDTKCKITTYCGTDNLSKALDNSSIVVVLTCCPYTDESHTENLFKRNAPLVKDVTEAIAKYSPKAFITIATNPITSLVPMATEIMNKHGFPKSTIFGITTLDVVRTNKFVAEVQGLEPQQVVVPVIGGNTKDTIVPVLSQAKPCSEFSEDEIRDITDSVRNAESKIISIKKCEGSTLSRGFAISRFIISLLKALKGFSDVIECSFVKGIVYPQLTYISTPLQLGPGGIMKNLGVPDISEYESCLLENATPYLLEDIQRGELFVKDKCAKPKPEEKPPNTPKCPADHCQQSANIGNN